LLEQYKLAKMLEMFLIVLHFSGLPLGFNAVVNLVLFNDGIVDAGDRFGATLLFNVREKGK
jgi:hypothetical protein